MSKNTVLFSFEIMELTTLLETKGFWYLEILHIFSYVIYVVICGIEH